MSRKSINGVQNRCAGENNRHYHRRSSTSAESQQYTKSATRAHNPGKERPGHAPGRKSPWRSFDDKHRERSQNCR